MMTISEIYIVHSVYSICCFYRNLYLIECIQYTDILVNDEHAYTEEFKLIGYHSPCPKSSFQTQVT